MNFETTLIQPLLAGYVAHATKCVFICLQLRCADFLWPHVRHQAAGGRINHARYRQLAACLCKAYNLWDWSVLF